MDELTPHIHATVVPIVTGERRKAKKEQADGKRKYRKKTDSVRLCADDVLSRDTMTAFHDSYAKLMEKYGLQRGVSGSEARYVSTVQYYRNIQRQKEGLQNDVQELQFQKQEAQGQLAQTKREIQTDKLKGAVTHAATNIVESVGSLFGSSKTKQQQIEALEADNCNLSDNIKNLNAKIKTMESDHKTAINKQMEQLSKIYSFFPHIKELLRWEKLLKNIGLPDDMIRRLFNKETVVGSGELYSKEHSKRFKAENVTLILEQDKGKPSSIRFSINGTDIFDWFKQKQQELLYSIGINIKEPKQGKGMKL